MAARRETGIARAGREGRAVFGTIDTWLVFKLSRGANFVTDYTNALAHDDVQSRGS